MFDNIANFLTGDGNVWFSSQASFEVYLLVILASISVGSYSSLAMRGSSQIDGYAGWIPLTAANLGLEFCTVGEIDPPDLDQIDPATQQSAFRAATKKADDKVENSISCDKLVDSSSVYLMELSIRDKLQGTSNSAASLLAQIHFIENLGSDKNIVPFLQYAMERVRVVNWTINGSDDGRPSESFKLVFEKFAVKYTPLEVDRVGKVKVSSVPHRKGFDQDGPKAWGGPW